MSEGLAAPQRRPRIVVAIAEAVALLALGIGAGYLLFGIPAKDTAAADAAAACQAIDRTPELTDGTDVITGVALSRWSAAHSLANAAAEQDPRYVPLDDALTKAHSVFVREYTIESDSFRAELDKAQVFCSQNRE